MIRCFGDSHISILSGENKLVAVGSNLNMDPFYITHLGPYIAYNLPQKNWGGIQLEASDSLLFSFGEIDCRCHIHKHVTSAKTYQNIIDNIVENYMNLLSGYTCKNIYILDITPCLSEYPFKMYFDQSPSERDREYHHQGTLEERNIYKKYMSTKLEEECNKRGYKFIKTFDYALNNKELYIDDIHLNGQKVLEHIKEQIDL